MKRAPPHCPHLVLCHDSHDMQLVDTSYRDTKNMQMQTHMIMTDYAVAPLQKMLCACNMHVCFPYASQPLASDYGKRDASQ